MIIWKYELDVVPEQDVRMPFSAKILTVQIQKEVPCIWVSVDPTLNYLERTIVMRGTGHDLKEDLGTYIGTFQQLNGVFVWHVFDMG